MVILIVAILCAIASFIYWCTEEYCDFWDIVCGIFVHIAILGLVGIVLIVTSSITNECIDEKNKTYELTDTIEIVALKDNQGLDGHFYLCGGYVKDELVYNYAYENEKGIGTNSVEADRAYIIYTNKAPKIEFYSRTAKFKNWYHYIYAIPYEDVEYCKVYVPEGTVTQEYKIDLE